MNLIFICGNALAGKDTLFKCFYHILGDVVECERFALADELKLVVDPYTKKNFNISAFTKDINEKTLIRPLMVETADIYRTLTKGKYWTGLLEPKIKDSIREEYLPIITDGRFCEYPEDEVWWAKNKMKGTIVHITRMNTEGIPVPPANCKEKENEPKLIENADFSVNWPTTDDFEFLCDVVKVQLKDLLEELCLKYQKKQILN